jgi:hypothetical protein
MEHLNVREMRKLAGVSQHRISAISGVGRVRISLAECGHVALRPEELSSVMRSLRAVLSDRMQSLLHVLQSVQFAESSNSPSVRKDHTRGNDWGHSRKKL